MTLVVQAEGLIVSSRVWRRLGADTPGRADGELDFVDLKLALSFYGVAC